MTVPGHIIIGLLGKIGCGKSACANAFKQEGCDVIDADYITKELLKKSPVKRTILHAFKLDRWKKKHVARLAFSSKHMLNRLTNILHPLILKELVRQLESSKSRVVVLDAPLLLEKRLDKYCDILLYIACKESLRFTRLSRRGLNKKEVDLRERYQLGSEYKRRRSDYIISNNGNQVDLRKKVRKFLDMLLRGGSR